MKSIIVSIPKSTLRKIIGSKSYKAIRNKGRKSVIAKWLHLKERLHQCPKKNINEYKWIFIEGVCWCVKIIPFLIGSIVCLIVEGVVEGYKMTTDMIDDLEDRR